MKKEAGMIFGRNKKTLCHAEAPCDSKAERSIDIPKKEPETTIQAYK